MLFMSIFFRVFVLIKEYEYCYYVTFVNSI